MLRDSIYSLTLRAVTLASKFLLILFMARYLSPEELGIYGLLAISISLALYVLGMDFYVFNTRELLASDEKTQACLIRDQLVFHGVVYLIVLPFLVVIFFFEFISWKYIGWFYLLLIFEHLSQEAYRLFITLSRPIAANLVLFLRSGAWAYAVIAVALLFDETRNLTMILLGWGLGIGISLILTVFFLRQLRWSGLREKSIDWSWIHKGLKTSTIFLGATIAFKLMEYADRFYIQHYLGEAMVGVYTFYIGIANVVQTFVFTGIISLLYPKIIKAHQYGNKKEYQKLIKKMGITSVLASLLLAGVAAIFIQPVLGFVDNPIYESHINVFWVMLLSVIVLIAGYVPHYALYVIHAERKLFITTLIGLAVVVIGNWFMVPRFGILGASIMNVIAMMTILATKSLLLFRLKYQT